MGSPALRRPAFWLAAGGVLLLAAPAAAQQPEYLPVPKNVDPLSQQRVRNMMDGREPVNKEDLDVLTKWLVYRMTYPQAHNPKHPGYGQNQAVGGIPIQPINQLVQTATQYILVYPSVVPGQQPRKLNENQLQYQREFGKLMVERLKEVLRHKEPVVRANAAWLLSLLGRSGYEDLADFYLEILTSQDERLGGEPQKLRALEGLRHLLAIRTDTETPAGTVIKNPERYQKVVKALIAFIERKPTLAADAPPDEVEAFRWVRREAVRALAQIRVSVVRTPPPNLAVASIPALTLLKVALRDGLAPEPNLAERVEAVVGFCNMATDSELEIDYAVYQVGEFVRDLGVYRKNGAEAATFPWRVAGARLAVAFEAWKREVSNLRAGRGGAKVTELADRANASVFGPLERADAGSLSPDGMAAWLQANQPKSETLVRGQTTSKVKLGQPPQFAPAAGNEGERKP